MKIIKFLICFSIIIISHRQLIAQESMTLDQKQGILSISVEKLKSNNGNVQIGLFNTEASWNRKGKAFAKATTPVAEKKAVAVFKNIPYGEYAVKFFHDENDDNELNLNFLKMPKENFGFSNNAKATFGPPCFEKAKFLFNSDSLHVTIYPN